MQKKPSKFGEQLSCKKTKLINKIAAIFKRIILAEKN
jgi:hypothetical protein